MAKNHGAKQQKKLAKQKAKRSEKRSILLQRTSNDPTVRLRQAEKWPVVQALVSDGLWSDGIGYGIIARRVSGGELIWGIFLLDVYCLGLKDVFWQAGSLGQFKELLEKITDHSPQKLVKTSPEALVKIVLGSVQFAKALGFPAHPAYRNTAMLLSGIDPATCPDEFTFGKDGKPFYVQGPFESEAQAWTIQRRMVELGGHFMIGVSSLERLRSANSLEDFDDDLFDDDDVFDELDEDEAQGQLEAPTEQDSPD